MRASEAPPLRASFAAAAIVLAMFGWGWWWWLDYHDRVEDLRGEHDQRQFERLARTEPGTLRVVGVGTSLLQCATLPGGALEELAADRGLPLVYVRTTRVAGGTRDWQETLEAVLAARPHVMVLEDFRVFYQMRVRRQLWERFLGLGRRMLRQAATSPSGVQLPPPPAVVVDEAEQADLLARQRQVGEGELRLRRQMWSEDLVFGLRPGSREILQRAAGLGIRTLVFEMPFHERFRATMPQDHVVRIREELRRLESEGLAEDLRCPFDFEEEDFIDLRHLGPAARERVSGWLLAELAARFPEYRAGGGGE